MTLTKFINGVNILKNNSDKIQKILMLLYSLSWATSILFIGYATIKWKIIHSRMPGYDTEISQDGANFAGGLIILCGSWMVFDTLMNFFKSKK